MTFSPMLAEKAHFMRMPAFAGDDDYGFQLKYDGDRVLLVIADGKLLSVIGRDGQRDGNFRHTSRFRSPAYRDSFSLLAPHLVVLDGEFFDDGTYVVFDLVTLEDELVTVLPSDPFSHRFACLTALFEAWGLPAALIRLAPTTIGHEAKLLMAMECLRTGGEGIIARRLDAPYVSGGRSWGIVKLKVEHDADLVVMQVGFEGRENVVLGAYPPGSHELVEVGHASTYGKHLGHLAVPHDYVGHDLGPIGECQVCQRAPSAPIHHGQGDVLTVRYNAMSKGSREDPSSRMVGPRIICRRTDKSASECSTEQLVYQEVPVS
jgi:ATP-dependent DNA ligase